MRIPAHRNEAATPRKTAGFTILELLVVLAIIAIAAGAVTYSSGRSMETARFRSFMLDTSAALTSGRSDAVRNTREVVFQVDVENRRLGYFGGGPVIELPPNVDLTALLAKDETLTDGVAGIRFYPTGGSSGGVLTFTYRGLIYEIRVNWLTGNVSTHRV